MDSLISIIVPIYNVKNYLEKCINSLQKQTYCNLEILLIDDGSTDGSGELCDRFAQKDKRIRVIHKENGGLSSARNAGIAIAKGKYLGFVDSDDYIHERMYETLYEKMLEYQTDISICNRYYTYEDGTKHIRYKSNGKDIVMNSEQAILEMNSFRSFDMAAWDKLYKRSLFEEIRFPEGKLSEDYFIMYRLFDLADKICYTPKPLYFYMQREGSISHNKKINVDFAQAAKEQMEFVEKKYPALKNCVHTAYASANMTVYDFYKKNKVVCAKDIKKALQKKVRENIIYIKNNKEISKTKVVQAYLFSYCIVMYDAAFYIYKKINRV